MLGNILTVTATDLITAAKFNEIQDQVYQVMGPRFYDWHGFQGQPVTTSTAISLGAWNDLYYDINRCTVHQTGNAVSFDLPSQTYPHPTVKADFVNNIIVSANQTYISSSTVHSSQLGADSFNSISTRIGVWNASMEHDVRYAWITSTDAEGFFALGGKFEVQIGYAGGQDVTDDNDWRALITSAISTLSTPELQFSLTDWTNLAQGQSKTVTAASYLTESIQIVYTKTNYEQLDVHVKFITSGFRTITLDVTSTVLEYYSKGNQTDLGGKGVLGIGARRPDVVTTLDLEGNQGFNAFRPRPAISLSPSTMSFSGYTSSTLATQVLTITNTGNTVTNISNINNITSKI